MIAFVAGHAAAETTFNLTAAGGSAEGLLTTINSGIDKAVSAAFPGSTITYQTSGGGMANIALVNQKRVPLGYIADGEMALALAGKPPFRSKIDTIRTIAYVAGWVPMQYVVLRSFAEKYKLKTLKDLAQVKPPIRLGLQQRGNVVSRVSEDMLQEIGITPADVKKWGGQVLYLGGSEFAPLMGDGRLDMMFNATPVKGRVASAVERAADVVMLDVDKALIDKIAGRWGLKTFTVEKGKYKWQPFDLYTVSFGIALVAHKDMPDQTAFNLAKAIVEQIDKIKQVHPFIRQLTPEYLVSLKVGEYHPGAVRYYKQAGLMK
ncbi:MAG: TAXI family TRAP transporter solute-binding subunit [Rhodospirillaceae bacterium]|nr:TAXI family TRAP transporter solute-binding subunit [Rhodospirillaceae bacterium]